MRAFAILLNIVAAMFFLIGIFIFLVIPFDSAIIQTRLFLATGLCGFISAVILYHIPNPSLKRTLTIIVSLLFSVYFCMQFNELFLQ